MLLLGISMAIGRIAAGAVIHTGIQLAVSRGGIGRRLIEPSKKDYAVGLHTRAVGNLDAGHGQTGGFRRSDPAEALRRWPIKANH